MRGCVEAGTAEVNAAGNFCWLGTWSPAGVRGNLWLTLTPKMRRWEEVRGRGKGCHLGLFLLLQMPQLLWVMTHKTHDGVRGVGRREGGGVAMEGHGGGSGALQGSREWEAPAAAWGCCPVPALKPQVAGSVAQQKFGEQLCLPSQGCGAELGRPDNRPDAKGVRGRAQLRELRWVESNVLVNVWWKGEQPQRRWLPVRDLRVVQQWDNRSKPYWNSSEEIVWQYPFKTSTTVLGSVQRQQPFGGQSGSDPSPRPPRRQAFLGAVNAMLLALRGAAFFHCWSYVPKEGDSSQPHHTAQVGSWINPGNQSLNTLKEKASHKITRFLQRHTQTQSCHINSLQTLRQMTV